MGGDFVDLYQSSGVGIHVSPKSLCRPHARAYILPFRAPTAGGQYHWVSMMAPQYCQKVFSYVTGNIASIDLNALLRAHHDQQAG